MTDQENQISRSTSTSSDIVTLADEKPGQQAMRVLYVDDDAPLIRLTTRFLQKLGYQVTGFTDAHAAIHEFRSNPLGFDFAVTDLSMPRLSGLDLAREFLTIRHDLPIVLASGHLLPSDYDEAVKIGIRVVISKPENIELLACQLDKVFRAQTKIQ